MTTRLTSALVVLALIAAACGGTTEDPLAVAGDSGETGSRLGSEAASGENADRELALTDDADASDQADSGASGPSDELTTSYCAALAVFVDATDASMDTEHVDWPADINAYAEVIDATAAEAPPASAAALDGFAALTRDAAAMTYDEFLDDEEFGARYLGYLFGELAVIDDDAEACGLNDGGSAAVTQDEIDAAQGWVDGSSQATTKCVVVDDETYTVDLTNTGDDLADYELAVTFTYADGSENTEAATSQIISALRPRERTIEEGWSLFEGTGDSCAVTGVRRAPTLTTADLPEPGDGCAVRGRDEFGHLEFDVTVEAIEDGDVWPTVAFIDEEGVRRATHMGSADGLSAGDVATLDQTNMSSVSDPTVVECEVVSRLNW